jgi:protoporphyrinogen oxidase
MYDTLAERIRSQGGTVNLGTSVTSIDPQPNGSIKVTANGATETYDRVVSTLPARATIGLTSQMPEAFAHRYSQGAALGAHCLVLELDRQVTDAYWIAINDPGYPFLAVVEHTNYIPPEEYGGKHLMYVGNYLPMNDPMFRRSKEELVAQFMPYLRRINPAMSDAWIKEVHSFAAPYAQPVVTKEFRQEMAPHITPIPNLYMANMFQVYPQDRGQNYSIAMAERLVRRLSCENRG